MAEFIHCPACGAEISASAGQCPKCGHPIQQTNVAGFNNGQPKPDTHLAKAIISTILCCLPLGIVSIIYSTKVDSLYALGDYEGAINASKKANKWGNWSIGVAAVCWVLYVLIYVVVLGGMLWFTNKAQNGGF